MTLDTNHLRALCEAATPSPWTWDDDDRPDALLGPPYGVEWLPNEPQRERIITTDSGCYGPNAADRAFIAAARTAVPELLDENERLRKAAMVVLAAVAFANDEAGADEIRRAVADLFVADDEALERWLDALKGKP